MYKHSYLPLLAVLLMPFEARAETCVSVEGDYEAEDIPCLESPLGLCADGALTGDLEVSYHSAFQTLVPAPTLQEPLRLAFTAEDVLESNIGSLQAHTSGWIVLADTTAAASCLSGCILSLAVDECLAECVLDNGHTKFESTLVFYEGTGEWSEVSGGSIVAPGEGDYLTQMSVGSYSGDICEE